MGSPELSERASGPVQLCSVRAFLFRGLWVGGGGTGHRPASSPVTVGSPLQLPCGISQIPLSDTFPTVYQALQTGSVPSSPRSPTHRVSEEEAEGGSSLLPLYRWGN